MNGLPRYFVGTHRDQSVCRLSSSGGAFTALTDAAFRQQGNLSVYGSAWSSELTAEHIRATRVEERDLMRGSKYIPSKLGTSFADAAADLCAGRYVVFSGTPCQIASLSSYLVKRGVGTERLTTISFICHGTGSKRFFRDYIEYLEGRYGGKAISANFRSKTRPGKLQDMSVKFSNGRWYRAASTGTDWFYSVYNAGFLMSPRCYECPYAGGTRPSDVDIADAWGQPWIDGKAPSLVIANTGKGFELVDTAREDMVLHEKRFDEVRQPQMVAPTSKPDRYDEFWSIYRSEGFMAVQRWIGNNTLCGRAKAAVVRIADAVGIRHLIRR